MFGAAGRAKYFEVGQSCREDGSLKTEGVKSICRDTGIEEEYRDALTGQKGQGSEGQEYGEYYVRVLYREICKINSPV